MKKSDFNLLTDYSDFQNKMTELDTLKVWMSLSACMYQGTEKLTITKENDSILIESEFSHSFGDGEFQKQQPIKISKNDTIWNFGKFLYNNKSRLIANKSGFENEDNYGTLQIMCGTTKIQFFTHGLNDLNKFIAEYSISMRNLNPENKNYIFGVEIPIIDTKGNILILEY